MSPTAGAGPASKQFMSDAKLIQDFADGVVEELVDCLGLTVEGRGWWEHGRAGEGNRFHVTDVDQAQRGLACDDYELAAFLDGSLHQTSKIVR
jgi:hypothetical protein